MGRICEICGVNPAMYVCSNCGRNVCSQCFEKNSWLCIECYNKRNQSFKEEMLWTSYPLFIKIFLIGFLLAFLGMIILMVAGLMEGVSQSPHSFYRTYTNNARSRETFFASNFLSHSTNNNRHSSILYFPENKFSEYRETAHHIIINFQRNLEIFRAYLFFKDAVFSFSP